MLRLADDLTLPDNYVTSTGALLAVRGAGKSNAGAVLAEAMFARRLPFVVVDPVAAWWGLRSSKDGKGPGLPIPIFGGEHGDVPLAPGAGELVADLVAGERLSCILDLKLFKTEADKRRFLLTFAQRLLRKNKDPLHLFLEEADDYLPQKPGKNQLEVLGAFEAIVRRGRSAGLGITLISQRSAVVNKNVLTQTETLFAMRNPAPQDIEAVRAWVKYHAQGLEILESLASLEDGEAWVWSPHFLKLKEPKRVQIYRRATFDSGATPKNVTAGSKRRAATLADIDLGVITARMQATIERQLAEDPAELRRQVATVRKDRDALQRSYEQLRRDYETTAAKVHGTAEIKRADITRVDKLAHRLDTTVARIQKDLAAVVAELTPAIAGLHVVVQPGGQATLAPAIRRLAARGAPVARPAPAERPTAIPRKGPPPPLRPAAAAAGDTAGGITANQQAILDALGWLEIMAHVAAPDRRQVALVAGRSAASSTWERECAQLRTAGLVDYPGAARMTLTDAGRALAQLPTRPPSLEELHAGLLGRLPTGQANLLGVLIAHHPDAVPRDVAGAECVPPQSPRSSTFERHIAALKALGLLEYPAQGQLRATDVLFLEATA
jgi:uncharacterized protein